MCQDNERKDKYRSKSISGDLTLPQKGDFLEIHAKPIVKFVNFFEMYFVQLYTKYHPS